MPKKPSEPFKSKRKKQVVPFQGDWENFLLLVKNEDFLEDVVNCRKEFGVPLTGFPSIKEYKAWESKFYRTTQAQDRAVLGKKIKELRQNSKDFSTRHHKLFVDYIFYDRVNFDDFPKRSNIFYPGSVPVLRDGKNRYFIEVFPFTNEPDIKNALLRLQEVMAKKGLLSDGPRPIIHLERDQKIVELAAKGLSVSEMTKAINKEYTGTKMLSTKQVKRRLNVTEELIKQAYTRGKAQE